jgi:hypothetical protein
MALLSERLPQLAASALPFWTRWQVSLTSDKTQNGISQQPRFLMERSTDYVASAIADKYGRGAVAAKIQAHVIVAVV